MVPILCEVTIIHCNYTCRDTLLVMLRRLSRGTLARRSITLRSASPSPLLSTMPVLCWHSSSPWLPCMVALLVPVALTVATTQSLAGIVLGIAEQHKNTPWNVELVQTLEL